jgi:tetratricopeptide (TPR) repeat protein
MKPAAIIVVLLAVAISAGAQNSAPAAKNQNPAQQAAAGAPPQGKRPPQAKTQPEFDAYKAAVANQADPAALEKATDDFAAKFPNSELIPLLYRTTMRGYQSANNADKLAEVSGKVLKADPDDPEALVNTAEAITERTHDTDLDKDQRFDEATKDAQRAIQTVETDVPTGVAPEQVEAYKGLLKSNAYSVLGTISFNQEKYADAESAYRKSIDAFPQPDPVVVLRLALSLDKQNRYPEALKEATRAVDMTQEATAVGKLARQERDRLAQLTGAAKPPAAASPSPSPGSAPAPANPQPH